MTASDHLKHRTGSSEKKPMLFETDFPCDFCRELSGTVLSIVHCGEDHAVRFHVKCFMAAVGSLGGDQDEKTVQELLEEIERGPGRRKHTQDWYAAHYGKLEDWARKILPEPWRNQFFSCIANGTYGHEDVGTPYMCNAGFMVTPSGYMKFDSAQEQILHDQCTRAENAEAALAQKTRECEEERQIGIGLAQQCGNAIARWNQCVEERDALKAQVEQLGRQVAEMRKPVTDEEWRELATCGSFAWRIHVDKIIASRARTK